MGEAIPFALPWTFDVGGGWPHGWSLTNAPGYHPAPSSGRAIYDLSDNVSVPGVQQDGCDFSPSRGANYGWIFTR